jgi:hypothetical protein
MKVYHDDGDGITDRSVKYLKQLLEDSIFTPLSLCVMYDREFSFELKGMMQWKDLRQITGTDKSEPCVILLSGCNCGYGGEGPHGTLECLKLLGNFTFIDQNVILSEKHVHIDFQCLTVTTGQASGR